MTKTDIEALMRPRYKVIADYPYSPFEIGYILEPDDTGELHSLKHGYFNTTNMVTENRVKKFPAIFKPLAWYEDREASEMPEYVKCIESREIHKVLSWSDKGFVYEKKSTNPIILPNVTVSMAVINYYEPATEADYLQYINNQKSKQ